MTRNDVLDKYGTVRGMGVTVAYGPDGPLLPAGAREPDPLEAPEQVQLDVPPDARYETNAALAVAAGWRPPWPIVAQALRRREAFRVARRRLEADRNPDFGRVTAAVNDAATDEAAATEDPAGPAYAALQGFAADMLLASQPGQDSHIALLGMELERLWLQTLHGYRRDIARSLTGRTDPASIALLREVDGMAAMISPPEPGRFAWRLGTRR